MCVVYIYNCKRLCTPGLLRHYRLQLLLFISEREHMFMFAICRRPSVCLSVVCRL